MKGEHSTGLHQHTGEREDLLLQTVPVGHTFNADVEKTLLMLITTFLTVDTRAAKRALPQRQLTKGDGGL